MASAVADGRARVAWLGARCEGGCSRGQHNPPSCPAASSSGWLAAVLHMGPPSWSFWWESPSLVLFRWVQLGPVAVALAVPWVAPLELMFRVLLLYSFLPLLRPPST